MTAAEELLLKLVLDAEGKVRHGYSTANADNTLSDALRAVMLERTPPEAKEKFMALHARSAAAQRELYAFTETLPGPVVNQWWREAEKPK